MSKSAKNRAPEQVDQGDARLIQVQKEETQPRVNKGEALDKVLVAFFLDVRSIQKAYGLVLVHVLDWLASEQKKHAEILEKYKAATPEEPNKYVAKSAHQAAEMLGAVRKFDGLGGSRIPETLQKSLFTQLFSEFDAFLGRLLKAVYLGREELLKGISKEITFSDLLEFENLNAVKLSMLEKEVETFRRDSYVEQFSNLEKKFGLKLKAFPEWTEFVEISQRRNILVHNAGIVSNQYLQLCDKEGHKFKNRPEIGDALLPDPEYFSRATIVISKVAFMLTHTLWRKLFPDEVRSQQEAANRALYELLSEQRWNTATEISKFCITEPMIKEIEEITLRIRYVNSAIARKFSGDEAGCKECLEKLDWGASFRDFRLAIAVLNDDFETAAGLMRLIGKNGEMVDELAYHQWPLFYKFRESSEFLNSYKEIYGTSYVDEAVKKSAEAAEAAGEKSRAAVDAVIKPKAKAPASRKSSAAVRQRGKLKQ
jgi:hypothetical protein